MQIVGYDVGSPERSSKLLFAQGKEIHQQALVPGNELEYMLQSRRCAGAIEENTHIACTNEEAPYCPQHTDIWPCARCRGDCSMPVANCHKPHVLYLAVFAPAIYKVGVTKKTRLEQRLYEQGADRGAYLTSFPNGRAARKREAELATEIGDRIQVSQKIKGLDRSVDVQQWEELLSQFDTIERYNLNYNIELEHAPIQETMVSGTVRGVKGRILLVENNNTVYATDLRDLVGYIVEEGSTDQNRQSSLDAF
ncbi:DUF2797 domain-containing protein [Salinarchaeum sp. IM2453]|uniref:DUF2797 domain-containing protein n=1 Tax=Salinarchaeum sp. IM2453 TaxID=2862870 RepID=UPI001C82C761|nr:DUF2797 domain-containing protein [Salinarchaeum sp. IM2453]QZA88695.1 DUF2797 domain-containing protein [Salinarchaeum sp. IM2453]